MRWVLQVIPVDHPILDEPANIVVVGLGDELLVFDTGPDSSANWFKHVLEEAARTSIERIRVIITHYHWDHTAGFPRLVEMAEKRGGPILEVYASSNTISVISDLNNIAEWVKRVAGILGEEIGTAIEAYMSAITYIYGSISKHADRLLPVEGLKEKHLEYFTCPGHTLCHACYRVANSILVAGDTLLPAGSPPIMDLEHYLNSLEKIVGIRWDKLAPGHGEAVDRAKAVEAVVKIASRKTERARRVVEILDHRGTISGRELVELAYETRARNYVELFTRAYNLIGYLEPLERREAIEISRENRAVIRVRDREALWRYNSELISRLKLIREKARRLGA